MRELIRSESGAARAVKEFQADFATDTVRDASLLLEVKVKRRLHNKITSVKPDLPSLWHIGKRRTVDLRELSLRKLSLVIRPPFFIEAFGFGFAHTKEWRIIG